MSRTSGRLNYYSTNKQMTDVAFFERTGQSRSPTVFPPSVSRCPLVFLIPVGEFLSGKQSGVARISAERKGSNMQHMQYMGCTLLVTTAVTTT